jgi:hypothetical protein
MPRPIAVVKSLAWLTLVGVIAAMSVEILLQYRVAIKLAYEPRTRIGDLDRAYEPFIVQRLHPLYFFFFPLDPAERLAMGNAVVSTDRDGFREPGPARANGRPLAVLIGGSSAFGQYASSNEGTITSYLNRLQDDYFFVNAAVPSWNSSQALIRLVFQIADMKPALVINYDGANDAALLGHSSPRTGLTYPPGTPDSFKDLEMWVDDIRSDRWLFRPPKLFPEIRHRLEKYLGTMAQDEEGEAIEEETFADAARHYLANQRRMALVTRTFGGRFISVFQPIASLHRNVPPLFREGGEQSSRFHRMVTAATDRSYEFHDLAMFFDGKFTSIPAGEPAGVEQPIFVDDVHLFDRGNEMVARQLLEAVRATPTPVPPTTTAPAPSSATPPRK